MRFYKRKSIKINAILSMINTFLTMAFSLVTYPYAARVLQVENLGKVNYSNSIVTYFALFASLGFSTYAIREGSKYRNDYDKLNAFASQVFSINCLTVMISYTLLIFFVFCSPNLRLYFGLIAIQSITIINNWIYVNWINVIFEDYLFITARSIIVQVLSIILLFTLVKQPSDYYVFASITIVSNLIVGILNFVYVRRYCKIRLVKQVHLKSHIKPVLVFFSNTLAVSIYVNSDTTMLGWILGSYQVGLYSVAVKIYTAIRTMIAAVYNVTIPRMSRYVSEDNFKLFKELMNKIINLIVFIAIPTTIGLSTVSKEMILLLSGPSYVEAQGALELLAFALLFAILGGVLAYCVDIPLGYEKRVMFATSLSAVENIILNLFFIPLLGIKGTALTTLLSEITVFLMLLIGLKEHWEYFDIKSILINLLKSITATIPLIPLKMFLDVYIYEEMYIIRLFVYFILAVIIYVLFGVLLRNDILLRIIKKNFTR